LIGDIKVVATKLNFSVSLINHNIWFIYHFVGRKQICMNLAEGHFLGL
jgi:hypothetical protein